MMRLLCIVYLSLVLSSSIPYVTGFIRTAFCCFSEAKTQFARPNDRPWRRSSVLSATHDSSSAAAATEPYYQISIEYCTGCKWNLRSFWMAQELLMTFENDPALAAVTLIPSRDKPGGVFRIECRCSSSDAPMLLWDRKANDGFPDLGQLKQLVRDIVAPTHFLGHSDTTDRREEAEQAEDEVETTVSERGATDTPSMIPLYHTVAPSVAITYCMGCRWLLRAAYLGQELMSTFAEEINSFSLIPSRPPAKGGTFIVSVDGRIVWDRTEQGRFPETPELKQLVRDELNLDKNLGHIDRKDNNEPPSVEEMDDDEAAEVRRFFGVM